MTGGKHGSAPGPGPGGVTLSLDEPLLPGAMPPRGPPRGDGDGPNRGVSKLALLRCGNEFIRELKWKVERRDVEIERLRNEVKRLRSLNEKISLSVGSSPEAGGMGPQAMTLVHPMDRPLSPPPEGIQSQQQTSPHDLIPVAGEHPREESSGSGSEGGY